MINATKRPINWTLVFGVVAIALLVFSLGGIWKFAGDRNELRELGEQYQRESEVLTGQLREAGEALAGAENCLQRSIEAQRFAEQRAISAEGRARRSNELATELNTVLRGIATGSDEIDSLLRAIGSGLAAIIAELSDVPDGSGTPDPPAQH